MSRFFSPKVECLEDRCVPDADPLLQAVPVAAPSVPPPTVNFVIDPPLIDPNAVPAPGTPPPTQTAPSIPPTDLILPIGVPFWY